MLDCEMREVRIGPVRNARRVVTSSCRVSCHSDAEIIRVDARLALVRSDRDPRRSPAAVLACVDGERWGPASHADPEAPLRLVASMPAAVPLATAAAHVSGTAYIGRWWPLDPGIVVDGDEVGNGATWCDALTAGTVRIAMGRAGRDGIRARVAHVTARLREPELIDGLPLVVLRAELVTDDGAVVATAHLVLASHAAGETEDPGSDADGIGTAAGSVRLPATTDAPGRLRVRLTLGVATYRYGRAGRVVPLGTAVALRSGALVARPAAGTSHRPLMPLAPQPGNQHMLQRMLADQEAHPEHAEKGKRRGGGGPRLYTGDDEFPYEWSSAGCHEWDDEPAPEFGDCVVLSYDLEGTGEESVSPDELSPDEHRNPASMCSMDLFMDPDDDPECRMAGARVTAVDMIWDGITHVPGVTPHYVREGEVVNHGPIVRLHLSKKAELAQLARHLFWDGVEIMPASRRARGGYPAGMIHERHGLSVLSDATARRWQVALLLGAGYRGKPGIPPARFTAQPLSESSERPERLDASEPLVRDRPRRRRRRRLVDEVTIRFHLVDATGSPPSWARLSRAERADLASLCELQLRWEPGRVRTRVPEVPPVVEVVVLHDGVAHGSWYGGGLWWNDRTLQQQVEPVLRFRLSEPMDADVLAACLAGATMRVRSAAQAARGHAGLLLADSDGTRVVWIEADVLPQLEASFRADGRYSGAVLEWDALRRGIRVSELRRRQ